MSSPNSVFNDNSFITFSDIPNDKHLCFTSSDNSKSLFQVFTSSLLVNSLPILIAAS